MGTRVVGDVAVRVGADVGPLKIGMQDAGRSVDRFGNKSKRSFAALASSLRNVTIVAAAAFAAVAAGGAQAIGTLDKIGKKAAQIGLTAEALQKLRFAAESAGVGNTSLESSLERLVKRLGEAEQGFGAAQKQLAVLGLSATELTNLPLEEALGIIADRMRDIEDPAQRAAIAAGLFGREGVAMVNMLKLGSEAMRETMQAASDMGAVIDNETVAAAEALQDRLGRLGDGLKGQLNTALIELGPLLVNAAEFALNLARGFNQLIGTLGNTFRAIARVVSPTEDLGFATDEVVAAMADEIRQSQQLEAAMEVGGKMSVEMARVKLQEAQARYKNAAAAIAEAQAIARGSAAFTGVTDQLMTAIDARNSIAPPGADEGQIPLSKKEQYEQTEQAIIDLMNRQKELAAVPDALNEQLETSKGNVDRLSEALNSVVNGVVSVGGGGVFEPIMPRKKGENGGGGSGGGGGGGGGSGGGDSEGSSFIDSLLGLDDVSLEKTRERMDLSLEQQMEYMQRAREALVTAREQGLIDQQQYNELSEKLEEEHSKKIRTIRQAMIGEALGATSSMFESLATIAGTGGAKILRISKIFGAAQALVNTMQGASEALKLPFPANIAAAAKVVASGAGFIAAIRGASPGGATSASASSGSGGAVQSAQPELPTRRIDVTLRGGLAGQAQGIRDIIKGINEELDDGADLRVNIA